jgi:hypothetical protein
MSLPIIHVPRVVDKSRSAFDANGRRPKDNKCVVFHDALYEAIIDQFYKDPTLGHGGEATGRRLPSPRPDRSPAVCRLFNSPFETSWLGLRMRTEGGRVLVE